MLSAPQKKMTWQEGPTQAAGSEPRIRRRVNHGKLLLGWGISGGFLVALIKAPNDSDELKNLEGDAKLFFSHWLCSQES